MRAAILSTLLLLSPALAGDSAFGGLELAEKPLDLLDGRMTIRMPAAAKVEARQEGVMAAPQPSQGDAPADGLAGWRVESAKLDPNEEAAEVSRALLAWRSTSTRSPPAPTRRAREPWPGASSVRSVPGRASST